MARMPLCKRQTAKTCMELSQMPKSEKVYELLAVLMLLMFFPAIVTLGMLNPSEILETIFRALNYN